MVLVSTVFSSRTPALTSSTRATLAAKMEQGSEMRVGIIKSQKSVPTLQLQGLSRTVYKNTLNGQKSKYVYIDV